MVNGQWSMVKKAASFTLQAASKYRKGKRHREPEAMN
jgi:hypothetical protein